MAKGGRKHFLNNGLRVAIEKTCKKKRWKPAEMDARRGGGNRKLAPIPQLLVISIPNF